MKEATSELEEVTETTKTIVDALSKHVIPTGSQVTINGSASLASWWAGVVTLESLRRLSQYLHQVTLWAKLFPLPSRDWHRPAFFFVTACRC